MGKHLLRTDAGVHAFRRCVGSAELPRSNSVHPPVTHWSLWKVRESGGVQALYRFAGNFTKSRVPGQRSMSIVPAILRV